MLLYFVFFSLVSCSFNRLGNRKPSAPGGGKIPDKFRFSNLGSSQGATESYGINIGTSRNALDIVSDDEVVEGYRTDSNITNALSNNNLLAFFISRTKTNRVMIQRPQVYVSGRGVAAKVSQWDGKPVKDAPLFSNPTETLGFAIQSTCHAKNYVKVTVTMRVFQTDAANNITIAKIPKLGDNIKEITFNFMKNCSKTTATEQSEALLGLHVTLQPDGGEVMRDGIPVSLFTVKSKKMYIANTTKLLFLVTAPNDSVLNRAAVVHNLDIASVDIFGDLDFRQQQEPHTLSLGFTCKQKGSTLITVFLTPQNTTLPARFSFRKTCAGTTTSKTIGVREEGLNIYSSGVAVVKNGLVQSLYRPAMKRSDDADINRPLIPGNQTEMVFVVTVPSSPKTSLRYPWVSATPFIGQHPIVRPKIKMDRKAWNLLPTSLNTTFRVQFGCFDEGTSNVVVTILVEEQGEIEFVLRKECAEKADLSTLDPVTKIEGLNIGLTPTGTEVADGGEIAEAFHWQKRTDRLDTLHVVSAQQPFITFYLSGPINFMYGPPQISAGEEIAEVDISGSGAQGGYLDLMHQTSTVSISFHCIVEGTAIFNLIFPLMDYVDPNEDLYDYDYAFSGRRLLVEGGGGDMSYEEKVLFLTFQKNCSLSPANSLAGLGGLYELGLMVCFSEDCSPPETSVVVKNGFPTAKFHGQRNLPPEQRYWDIISNTTLSTRLFILLDRDQFSTNTLDISPPLILRDNKICSPELSGSAKAGVKLHRGRKIAELDITYNCEYEGLAILSVILPIAPRGNIAITLAKQCSGASEPAGVLVSGLNIGTTKEGHEVVENGLTVMKFNKYSPGAEETFVTEKDQTVFYISRSGSEPLRALEPFIFAHRPVVSVYLSHELHIIEATKEEDDDVIVISDVIQTLNISYACFASGSSPVTLTIPLLPEGTVQFTWMKACEGSESFDYSGIDDYGGDIYGYDQNEVNFNEDVDARRSDGLGYINVGTTAKGVEVVENGKTSERYTMSTSSSSMRTIMNKNVAKAAFYLSVPEGSEVYSAPIVRVLNNAHGTVVCHPSLTGEAAMGGTLTPNKPVLLVVEFNCIEGATGVSPVLITIPLPNGGNPISFRVVKICGVFEVVTDMAWTPALVLWVALGVIVALLSLCGILWLKCRSRGIKYSKVGARARMPTEVPIDGDDELSD